MHICRWSKSDILSHLCFLILKKLKNFMTCTWFSQYRCCLCRKWAFLIKFWPCLLRQGNEWNRLLPRGKNNNCNVGCILSGVGHGSPKNFSRCARYFPEGRFGFFDGPPWEPKSWAASFNARVKFLSQSAPACVFCPRAAPLHGWSSAGLNISTLQ